MDPVRLRDLGLPIFLDNSENSFQLVDTMQMNVIFPFAYPKSIMRTR